MNTNTITVNISDYLSDDDMRQIAIEQFRAVAAQKACKDFERILDNAAYELVRREVDSVFDGGMAETVKAKAIEVIGNLSTFTVFKKPDVWDRGSSKAWDHLQAAMDGAQPAISDRVQEIVSSLDRDYLYDLICEKVGVAIMDKLTSTGAAP